MQIDCPPTEYKGRNKRILMRYRTSTGAVEDLKIYILTAEYQDGRLGEVSIKASNRGSTISGLLDALSITMSLGLQHGVPLEQIVGRLRHMRFEPAGTTDDPASPRATSIVDAVAGWLESRYGKPESAG